MSSTTAAEAADVGSLGYPELYLLIDGERVAARARETIPVVNPATGHAIGELPVATTQDLGAAAEAAARGFQRWRSCSAVDRAGVLRNAARLLRERRDRIARILTLEQGKPLAESRAEIEGSASVLEWFAEEGRRAYGRIIPGRHQDVDLQVRRCPIGPCALFTPWNFPADLPSRKLAAALAAGCSAVIKPAEETPATALEIVSILHEAGLPNGVVNVVFGRPDMISQYLVSEPRISKVSFTGSVPVGKRLARIAAEHLKPITLELGGHSPVVVLDDVDIDRVTTLASAAKFRNAGQVCISPNRFLVHERIYSEFAAQLTKKAQRLHLGDGLNPTTTMGPLAHGRRIEAMERLVQDATDRGAKVSTGGARAGDNGYFFEPTVILGASASAALMNEEPFGPIAPVVPFTNLDAALHEVNRLSYGLAAYAFTNSLATARRIADACESGMVGINTFAVALPEAPFGGVKDSGHGSENGVEGLDAYLHTKFVAHSV
jgi:succinate-semialdehyde dehydrogenase/glutarate-semialdehyde dehydrogenase